MQVITGWMHTSVFRDSVLILKTYIEELLVNKHPKDHQEICNLFSGINEDWDDGTTFYRG